MKKFYEIRKDCLNKKYFRIDDIDNGNVKKPLHSNNALNCYMDNIEISLEISIVCTTNYRIYPQNFKIL